MTETERYVPLDEGAERAGLTLRTFRRRVAAGAVPLFIDGKDHRRRLVRLGDVDELTRPRPIERRTQEVEPLPAA